MKIKWLGLVCQEMSKYIGDYKNGTFRRYGSASKKT